MLVAVAAVEGAILLWYILTTGVSAREQPGSLEEFAARRADDVGGFDHSGHGAFGCGTRWLVAAAQKRDDAAVHAPRGEADVGHEGRSAFNARVGELVIDPSGLIVDFGVEPAAARGRDRRILLEPVQTCPNARLPALRVV